MAQKFDNGTKLVFLTAVTDRREDDIETLGALRQEGDKYYRWVRNDEAAGTAFRAGDICCYDLSDNESLHETVLRPVTADLAFMAGIVMTALDGQEYGWIQIEGWYDDAYVLNSASNNAIATQDILGVADSGRTLVKNVASGAISTINQFGYCIAMEARASGTTFSGSNNMLDVWVHCRTV